jgi:hypothetical protein
LNLFEGLLNREDIFEPESIDAIATQFLNLKEKSFQTLENTVLVKCCDLSVCNCNGIDQITHLDGLFADGKTSAINNTGDFCTEMDSLYRAKLVNGTRLDPKFFRIGVIIGLLADAFKSKRNRNVLFHRSPVSHDFFELVSKKRNNSQGYHEILKLSWEHYIAAALYARMFDSSKYNCTFSGSIKLLLPSYTPLVLKTEHFIPSKVFVRDGTGPMRLNLVEWPTLLNQINKYTTTTAEKYLDLEKIKLDDAIKQMSSCLVEYDHHNVVLDGDKSLLSYETKSKVLEKYDEREFAAYSNPRNSINLGLLDATISTIGYHNKGISSIVIPYHKFTYPIPLKPTRDLEIALYTNSNTVKSMHFLFFYLAYSNLTRVCANKYFFYSQNSKDRDLWSAIMDTQLVWGHARYFTKRGDGLFFNNPLDLDRLHLALEKDVTANILQDEPTINISSFLNKDLNIDNCVISTTTQKNSTTKNMKRRPLSLSLDGLMKRQYTYLDCDVLTGLNKLISKYDDLDIKTLEAAEKHYGPSYGFPREVFLSEWKLINADFVVNVTRPMGVTDKYHLNSKVKTLPFADMKILRDYKVYSTKYKADPKLEALHAPELALYTEDYISYNLFYNLYNLWFHNQDMLEDGEGDVSALSLEEFDKYLNTIASEDTANTFALVASTSKSMSPKRCEQVDVEEGPKKKVSKKNKIGWNILGPKLNEFI